MCHTKYLNRHLSSCSCREDVVSGATWTQQCRKKLRPLRTNAYYLVQEKLNLWLSTSVKIMCMVLGFWSKLVQRRIMKFVFGVINRFWVALKMICLGVFPRESITINKPPRRSSFLGYSFWQETYSSFFSVSLGLCVLWTLMRRATPSNRRLIIYWIPRWESSRNLWFLIKIFKRCCGENQ